MIITICLTLIGIIGASAVLCCFYEEEHLNIKNNEDWQKYLNTIYNQKYNKSKKGDTQ